MTQLERRDELDADDMLRAHVMARMVLNAWRGAGMTLDGWRVIQPALHEEFALLVEEAYHEVNRWLHRAPRDAGDRFASADPPSRKDVRRPQRRLRRL